MTVSARIKTNHPDYPNFTTTKLEVALQPQGKTRAVVNVTDSRTGMVLQLRPRQAEALADELTGVLQPHPTP